MTEMMQQKWGGRGVVLVGLLALGACSSVSYREDVAQHVQAVRTAELRTTLEDLEAIGPRPLYDTEATHRTLDYLTGRLEDLGLDVEIKTYQRELAGSFIARVRPAGDSAAEFTDLPVSRLHASSGPAGMAALAQELREEGYEVRGFVLAAGGSTTVTIQNLLATKRGGDPTAGVVELAAHYDTVADCPGADDNSTGVSALLEIARVLRETNLETDVRLCFFGAEELGLWGSELHAAEYLGEGTRVEALINLDSIGFTAELASSANFPDGMPWYLPVPDEGDFILVVGSFWEGWLGNLVEDAADTYDTGLEYYSANRIGAWFDDAHRSDHAHYWEAGVPAVFLTDSGDFRSPHYHKSTDTLETLDLEFVTAVTRATLAATMHLAGVAEE